jgi:lipoate synthase
VGLKPLNGQFGALINNVTDDYIAVPYQVRYTFKEVSVPHDDNNRYVDCDILTLGQYLQPTAKHLAVQGFIQPEQFDTWCQFGESIGFLQVVASPLTRSSYHAEQVRALMQRYPR